MSTLPTWQYSLSLRNGHFDHCHFTLESVTTLPYNKCHLCITLCWVSPLSAWNREQRGRDYSNSKGGCYSSAFLCLFIWFRLRQHSCRLYPRLSWNSLCSSGWSQIQWSSCLSIPNAEVKGMSLLIWPEVPYVVLLSLAPPIIFSDRSITSLCIYHSLVGTVSALSVLSSMSPKHSKYFNTSQFP